MPKLDKEVLRKRKSILKRRARAVKLLMVKRGLTGMDIARMLGWSKSKTYYVLSCEHPWRKEVAEKICEVLQCSLEELDNYEQQI